MELICFLFVMFVVVSLPGIIPPLIILWIIGGIIGWLFGGND